MHLWCVVMWCWRFRCRRGGACGSECGASGMSCSSVACQQTQNAKSVAGDDDARPGPGPQLLPQADNMFYLGGTCRYHLTSPAHLTSPQYHGTAVGVSSSSRHNTRNMGVLMTTTTCWILISMSNHTLREKIYPPQVWYRRPMSKLEATAMF